MKKAKREIQKTIRMSQDVYEHVCRMGNKSFNDSFEKLVLFCLTREKVLHEQIKEYETKIQELKHQIQNYEEIISDLDELKKHISKMMEKSKR